MLVVFDIDGTLSNIEHRLDYVRMWRDNGIFVFNVYQGEEDF